MNQMDENYWKKLAEDWIKRQSQNDIPTSIPEAPKISNNYDNLAVADMEIEDMREEEPPTDFTTHHFHQLQTQQQFPLINSSRFHKEDEKPRKNFISHHQPTLVIPDPPIINSIEDQINTVDMDMDDSENEDSNSNSSSANLLLKHQKKLPLWIREGLEKMKREKELEESRIQDEIKRKQDEENRKRLMEEALKEIEREKKVSKSKYESSDSETEETDPHVPQTKSIEDDEEAYENMMLLVRKTCTSLFLEVTNEKIQEISNETLAKYRKKASGSTKPAIIKLGLGAYSDSSTDDDGSDGENNGSNSDWESESVLKERIHQKQMAFEKRVRERMEQQQAVEQEEERVRKRSSSFKSDHEQLRPKYSDSDDDKHRFKNTRKDGEEKYETMIYSISTSSGPIVRVPREKRTRFSDPKDGRSTQMTHLGMVDSSKVVNNDNGVFNVAQPKIPQPTQLPEMTSMKSDESSSNKKEKKDKKKRRNSSSSSSSSDSGHRSKKHKKHKKSSKHSKKSSKKRDRSRSRSRSRDRDKKHHRSDRRSIESKSSIRSSESSHRRSRSHSKSRDKHRRRY